MNAPQQPSSNNRANAASPPPAPQRHQPPADADRKTAPSRHEHTEPHDEPGYGHGV